MKCCKCKNLLTEDSKFCEGCGQRVVGNYINSKSEMIKIREITSQTDIGIGVKKDNTIQINIKKFSMFFIIIIMFYVGISAYLKYFVDGPDETINKFVQSYNESNLSGIIECLDPLTQKEFSAATSLFGGIMGSLTGIDIDLSNFIDLSSYIIKSSGKEVPQISIHNIEVISYSGNKLVQLVNDYNFILPGIEKLLADEAIVSFTVSTPDGSIETEELLIKNYGNKGWLIPINKAIY